MSAKATWTNPKAKPAKRLHAFHRWLQYIIAKAFAGEKQLTPRLLGQLKNTVLKSVRELNDHGYLLDGDALAEFLQAKLSNLEKYHKTGHIRTLYPYFKNAWDGYVRIHAEELKEQSMSIGMHISNLTTDYKPTIPELEAQRHKESLTEALKKQRKRTARKASEAKQQTLF